eukprot:7084177-Alexandrium_andersonii.AAC.1
MCELCVRMRQYSCQHRSGANMSSHACVSPGFGRALHALRVSAFRPRAPQHSCGGGDPAGG